METTELNNESIIVPDKTAVTYNNYLKVDGLLSLQRPLTSPQEQDEMLFIIIHQVYELWFKQIMHEIDFASSELASGKLLSFIRTMKRVHKIQDILIQQVDVLETMTPIDFNKFRSSLNPASGFQSVQFRMFEYRLGLKDANYMKFFKATPEYEQKMKEVFEKPSLYLEFLHYLENQGFSVPDEVLNQPVSGIHKENDELTKVFLEIYQSSEKHYNLYLALESLLDLDEKILLWRYRHVAMVERMIGKMKGTGGSSGVNYLSSTLSKKAFPELWSVRNLMG